MRAVKTVVLGCLALASSSAMADTIEGRYTSLALGSSTQTVKMRSTGGFLFTGEVNVYAGPLNHQVRNGTGSGAHLNPSSTATTIATFCTEVTQYVASGSTWRQFDIIPLATAPKPGKGVAITGMGAMKAHAIALLWAGVSDKFTDAAVAAAFQIAIWEIVYDFNGTDNTTFNLGNGNLYFTSNAAAKTKASELFNNHVWDSINGSLRSETGARGLKVMSHEEYQDQIVVIPLPTGGLLATAGLLGLAAIRRRR